MAKKVEQIEEPLEKQLWKAADKLRKNIDAAEYKHVVLGLIFLRYISVSFEQLYDELVKQQADPTPKTARNMPPRMCFTYRRMPDGVTWFQRPRIRRLASILTMRWMSSSARTSR